MAAKPRVVIIGGGFAGLYAARSLADQPLEVTLIDRRNHHLFQPLLYQVASAALNPSDIAAPIRAILGPQENAHVLLGEASTIDLAEKRVRLTDGGELHFDYLVVATGATHAYFGRDDWARLAPGLKTIEDALEIRRRVFFAYEAAEREDDPARRRAWLTFCVVGAGPTGVELAGALTEIARRALVNDFRSIDPSSARVILLEGMDRVLPPFSPDLSAAAKAQLEHLGVEVRLGARVTEIDEDGVSLGAERIPTKTVLWAAGVAASPLGKALGVPLDRAGRVKIGPLLTIPGRDDVFVVGDLASFEQDGKPIPGVAPAAIQMGKHVAENIARRARGEALAPFRYKDKGSLATIGRAAAVAHIGRLKLTGFVAWLAWLLIHVAFLVGFRNRFLVIAQWVWAYWTDQRGARLITGDIRIPVRTPPGAGAEAAALAPAPMPALHLDDKRPDGASIKAGAAASQLAAATAMAAASSRR
jgi:NADH dehydrogenase